MTLKAHDGFRWKTGSVSSAPEHTESDYCQAASPSPFRKYHQSLQTLKPIRWSSSQSVSLIIYSVYRQTVGPLSVGCGYYMFYPLQSVYWVMFPCLGPTLWTMQVSCPLRPLSGWPPWCGPCSGISWTWALSTCLLWMWPTPAEKGLTLFLLIHGSPTLLYCHLMQLQCSMFIDTTHDKPGCWNWYLENESWQKRNNPIKDKGCVFAVLFSNKWMRLTALTLTVCVVQALQTLGGRSGKGGPGKGLFGSSDPPLSKNQADPVRLYWCPCDGGGVSGPGNFIWILISTVLLLPLPAPSSGLLWSVS